MDGDDSLTAKADSLTQSSDALKASVRIHLFTLLCEEMKIACARQLEDRDLVVKLINLLASGQRVLAVRAKGQVSDQQQPSASDSKANLPPSAATDSPTPKWLAPLLLLLDLYEKMALGTRRRTAMEKVTSHMWKWFDIVSGKWCPYTAANNKIIDDAFWAGQNSIRVTAGRRRYLLQFSSMIQVNEETGNRRPMMLSLKGLFVFVILSYFFFVLIVLGSNSYYFQQKNQKKVLKKLLVRQMKVLQWKWTILTRMQLKEAIYSVD